MKLNRANISISAASKSDDALISFSIVNYVSVRHAEMMSIFVYIHSCLFIIIICVTAGYETLESGYRQISWCSSMCLSLMYSPVRDCHSSHWFHRFCELQVLSEIGPIYCHQAIIYTIYATRYYMQEAK